MDERDFFDKLAPTWDENEIMSTPANVSRILSFMDIRPGQSVLDLGTGTGVLLPFIAEKIGKDGILTAVDYSTGMLDIAKRKFSELVPKPKFLNLDFEIETIEGEYDRIILYCVYPHLHTPIETLKWLMKVNLKPNGLLFIAFPCPPDFINNIHREKHSDSDILPEAEALASYLRSEGFNAKAICNDYVVSLCDFKS